MAIELTPLGKGVVIIVKWLIVPLFAAFIGYALIGPRIGGSVAKKMKSIPGIGSAFGDQPSKDTKKPLVNDRAKEFQSIRGIGD
jgi:hypothetical protein